MTAMSPEQQSTITVAIVLVTVAVFLYRTFSRKKAGCGSSCGCAMKGGGKQKL
jgi:hypothetical protein